MPDIILDQKGIIRRCGSLPIPVGAVCALPPFGADPSQPIWSDEVIKAVVTDPSRVPSRELFPPAWILDQQSTSACNGYALGAGAARARHSRGIHDGMLFSGAFPYAQMKQDGQDNGSMIHDGIKAAQDVGFLPLSRGPYNKINRRDYTKADYEEAAKYKGLKVYRLTSLAALQTALANRWPCVVAVHAGGNFTRLDSKGVAGVDWGSGNHACVVQDALWDGKRWLYDLVNSWGVDYGRDGCAYVTDQHFRQTMGPHEFICVPTFDNLAQDA